MTDRRARATADARLARLRTHTFAYYVAPWVAILLIASGFHFYRRAPIDGTIYLLVAMGLLADAAGLLAKVGRTPIRLPPRGPLVVAAVVLGVPLAITPRYGITDVIVISAIGIGVLVATWPVLPATHADSSAREPSSTLPPAAGPAPRTASRKATRLAAQLWAGIGILVCLWELSAFFLGQGSPESEYAFPPLSDLVGPMLDSLVGRVLLVAAWLAGGIALLNRGRSR